MLSLVGLVAPGIAFAQVQQKATLRVGLTTLNPFSSGKISGPAFVVRRYSSYSFWPDSIVYYFQRFPLDPHFRAWSFAGVYAGVCLEKWKIIPGLSIFYGGIQRPRHVDASFVDWELSLRYAFLKGRRVALDGLASLRRVNAVSDTPDLDGYDFNEPFWLPGLGIGISLCQWHAEVKFHKWPGLVVGRAAVPDSEKSSSTWKEVRLDYAVSFSLGLEFSVLKS